MSAAHPYELLAGLLCYPAPATVVLASECRAALEPTNSPNSIGRTRRTPSRPR